MKRTFVRAAALFAVFVGACAAPGAVEPLAIARDVAQISDKEPRLWNEARDIDEALRKADQIYEDAELEEYLQQVVDRLYSEFEGAVRIRVLKSPVLNAFALPNGSIYINVGLLARLDMATGVTMAASALMYSEFHWCLHRLAYRSTKSGS